MNTNEILASTADVLNLASAQTISLEKTASILATTLNQFNLTAEEIKYDVITKGSKGFLSIFGLKPAVVRFYMPEEKDIIRNFLEKLLEKMEINYNDIAITYHKNRYQVHITGTDNTGFLIGKEGKMLDSIQHLLNRVINTGRAERSLVILNVENYRNKKVDSIKREFGKVVSKVKSNPQGKTDDNNPPDNTKKKTSNYSRSNYRGNRRKNTEISGENQK
jgi:predicted RNA-binding protein Jag